MLLKGPEITDQKCIDDMLMIHGGFPIPNICGTNTNQHCKFFFILLVSRHSCLRAPPTPQKNVCKQKQCIFVFTSVIMNFSKTCETKRRIKNPNKEGNLLLYVTLRFFNVPADVFWYFKHINVTTWDQGLILDVLILNYIFINIPWNHLISINLSSISLWKHRRPGTC